MSTLTISGSPHIHTDQSVRKIMTGVIYALIPAFLVSVYFFGLDALLLTVVSVASCMLFEYLIQKYLIKGDITITDGSAVITGVLLAFNVPSNLPLWIIIIGAFVSIGIGKMAFGGLGKNIFNPALVGRVFLLLSFPVQMTSWPVPRALFMPQLTDAVTGPTALGILKEGLEAGRSVQELMPQLPSYVNDLLGNQGGSIGEVSAIALLLGAAYLLYKKIITWHIPVAYLGSAFVFASIMHLINPSLYITPFFHLITGGMLLGVFYMATDMVSSPMSPRGMIIFGLGCGIITMLIRIWGSYPEGVSFAILLMNAVTPLINRGFKPARFG
ncbi:MAG: RnfABCDGE type electron transport complex subunit D [Bacteroidales bacterium]|nr:RnfABCDGE type electron transport complex subunit D [Bacteroidales bacterium]